MDEQSKRCERPEPIMTWAVRSTALHRAVHISMLEAEENGTACRCLCFGCGQKLRAINVNKPATHFLKTGTQRPHFKHDGSGADRKCLSAVARRVALWHFVEQEEVILPARTLCMSRRLANGTLISEPAEAPGMAARVLERRWIDDQSAILVLANGRELTVTIRSVHTIKTKGASTSVLSLAGINDPEVAGWTKDQILEQLRLPGWMTWEKHWADEGLEADIGQRLNAAHQSLLGDIPEHWLDGLSGKMASETILHWIIKRSLESYGQLAVPEYAVPRRRQMPDGTYGTETVRWPQRTLQIERTSFERKIGAMVPDVLCWVRTRASNQPPFPLLVEAAVTHYIDEEKRQKILSSGMACIQIRADLFQHAGAVPVADIERTVRSDASVKEWISPPDLKDEIERADQRLLSKANTIRDRLEREAQARRDEEKRRARQEAWIASAPDEAVATGYLKALRAVWNGDKQPSVDRVPADVNRLWQALVNRRLVKGAQTAAEAIGGALWLISTIRYLPCTPQHTTEAIDLVTKACALARNERAPNAVIAVYALQTYHKGQLSANPALPSLDEYKKLVEKIGQSLGRGDEDFVRCVDLDPLLRILFPEMSTRLNKPKALAKTVQEAREQRLAEEARQRMVKERRARRLSAVAKGRAAQKTQNVQRAISAKVDLCARKTRWTRTQFVPSDASRLHSQLNISDLNRVRAMALIKKAIDHKMAGRSIKALFESLELSTPDDVHEALSMLHQVGICMVDDMTLIKPPQMEA